MTAITGAAGGVDTYYGVSKAFGEALGRLYAEKWGISVVCIRIGTCIERPLDTRHLSTWLSPRDAVALLAQPLTRQSSSASYTACRPTPAVGGI
jgi:uronate dehydrogenase